MPANLQAALLNDPLVKVADIPAASGHPSRGVFVQETSVGYVCVWDAPNATSQARRGGCNRDDAPLGGKALSANLTYDGGPSISAITDAVLFGLTAADVEGLEILMSDGTTRTVQLRGASVGGKAFRAFGYRLKQSDLRDGVGPVAAVALDGKGAEIDRQPTGFGS
jgi:hypothetical protein